MAQIPHQDKIHQSTNQSRKHRALVAEYGDGYKQTVQDGINASRTTYSLVWHGLTLAEKNQLDDFLNDIGNWDVFQWTGLNETQVKDWRVIDSHSINTKGGDVYSVTTQVEEFF